VDTIYGNDSTGSVGGSPFKTVNKAVSSVSSGQTPTAYTLTFTDGDIQKTFYNSLIRFNTGDSILLYLSYTGAGANNAHDLTVQLDLF